MENLKNIPPKQDQPLQVNKQIEEIRAAYQAMMGEQISFSCLLMGIFGSGKTTLACTGRLPILIDMFDPKGSIVFHVNPMLNKLWKEGKIIIRPYWNENSQKPSEYERWAKQWESDCKTGFLSNFGTYLIDSGTTWTEAMANYVVKKKGRLYDIGGKKIAGNLEIQDYIPMYNMILDTIKISSSQGCDFIYTAHLILELDEITKKPIASIDTYSKLKSKIPKLFSEKYVITKTKTPGDPVHELLLHSTGTYEASSQLLSSGKMKSKIQNPNLKDLLKLAGLPHEDKPIPWAAQA